LLSISIPLLQDTNLNEEAGTTTTSITTTPRTATRADLLTTTTIASTTTFIYSTETTTYLSTDLQRFYCSYLKNTSFVGYFNLEHVCTLVTKIFDDKVHAAHSLNLSSIIPTHN